MNYSLYLMRHAPSEHNRAKEEWKKAHPDSPNYKDAPDYQTLKHSADLIDPSVVDSSCIDRAKKVLDAANITLILCSPMRRCLQTCAQLLESSKWQARLIVEPLLSSRLNSAWSIGSSIR